jgi:hypothetical protein
MFGIYEVVSVGPDNAAFVEAASRPEYGPYGNCDYAERVAADLSYRLDRRFGVEKLQ